MLVECRKSWANQIKKQEYYITDWLLYHIVEGSNPGIFHGTQLQKQVLSFHLTFSAHILFYIAGCNFSFLLGCHLILRRCYIKHLLSHLFHFYLCTVVQIISTIISALCCFHCLVFNSLSLGAEFDPRCILGCHLSWILS